MARPRPPVLQVAATAAAVLAGLAACRGAAAGGAGRHLEQVATYAVTAGKVAFAADGDRWYADQYPDTVIYEGDVEVGRLALGAMAGDDQLFALTAGHGVAVGARIFDAQGRVAFEAFGYAQRYGRFAGVDAQAVSADGDLVLLQAQNHPSACLCDKGVPYHDDGAVILVDRHGEAEPTQRILIDGPHRDHYRLAIGAARLVVADGAAAQLWPRDGHGDPTAATLGVAPTSLTWTPDGARLIAASDATIVVHAGDALTEEARWDLDGELKALAVRPDGKALAAVTYDRDMGLAGGRMAAEAPGLLGAASGCELVIYDLAGEVLTRAPLPRAPYAVAWSPDGRELLVSMPDATDSQVSRYLVRR